MLNNPIRVFSARFQRLLWQHHFALAGHGAFIPLEQTAADNFRGFGLGGQKKMLERKDEAWGNKTIIKYNISQKGKDILGAVLEPYEELFPREDKEEK